MSSGLQLFQQVLVAETFHQVDTDGVSLAHLHRPGHAHGVGRGGVELGESCDRHGPRGSSGAQPGLVVGQGVRQGTQLVVHLQRWSISILILSVSQFYAQMLMVVYMIASCNEQSKFKSFKSIAFRLITVILTQ